MSQLIKSLFFFSHFSFFLSTETFAGIRKIGTKETIVRVSKEKEEPKEKEKVKRRKTIFGGKKKKEKGTKIAELNETIISPDSVGTPATLEQVLHICHVCLFF